jgi:uncharacterized protein YeaO (DUF488 family)
VIRIKRIYDKPARSDGFRVLVDRLWPRGLTKERAALNEWLKDVAPTSGLRKWFGHDPEKWSEFRNRYKNELAAKGDILKQLKAKSRGGTVTLLYGARDSQHNEAVVLAEVLRRRTR